MRCGRSILPTENAHKQGRNAAVKRRSVLAVLCEEMNSEGLHKLDINALFQGGQLADVPNPVT
jgi:hypothetical protein